MGSSCDNKPELLAPAGGWEQLFYALHFGADAVYLACDRFGLRQRASNFSLADLPRAVEVAHAAGARVYVTCNAYAHDADLADLPVYAQAMERAGADAAIVSDLGVLAVVQESAPSLALHVSTQASVSNAAAARMWYRLGARRVVCAREMSLAEIAAMRAAVPDDLEIEAFVHGAMCMAVSGRCLISDYMTGRPANKGQCTQPCRWRYDLVEPSRATERFSIEEDAQGTYLLNSKDLNMLANLDELAAAGVDSLKIEGRVKKAFYVATVTNAYRQVLDGGDPEAWERELEIISHRPYSTGFYFGDAEQSVDDDVYVQLYDWVGEVIGSSAVGAVDWDRGDGASDAAVADEGADAGRWRVECRCRNRFYAGDELEVLSPAAPVRRLVVEDLVEIFDEGEGVPVEKASRAMGRYAFVCDLPLEPRDILRVRRKDPARKN